MTCYYAKSELATCQIWNKPLLRVQPYRSVAQLVEHRSPKPGAGGSSPSTPAISNPVQPSEPGWGFLFA